MHRHEIRQRNESLIPLNETYAAIEQPIGLIGVTLYDHQRVAIQALYDAENNRVLNIDTDEFRKMTDKPVLIESSAIVLSDSFGSGKTLTLITHIMNNPIPKAVPARMNSITIVTQPRWRRNRSPTLPYQHDITCKHIGQGDLIKSNLIVVGSSVLMQWQNVINTHTKLRCFMIGDLHQLKEFYAKYMSNQINQYHIILLKNGVITGRFEIAGEESIAPQPIRYNKTDRKHQPKELRGLVETMGEITRGKVWSRVVYDDFDTISIPPGTHALRALFTIYVSATKKDNMVRKNEPAIEYTSLIDMFRRRQTPLGSVISDNTLFANFNVRNDANFIERSINIPIINGFLYVYKNPDNAYIRMLGAMGDEDARNVMEMLNGDAIATAAEAMGIKTTSVADIFQRMLDKKYEKFIYDKDVLELLSTLRTHVQTLAPHHEDKRRTYTELDAIRKQIEKKHHPAPTYYCDGLMTLIDDMTAEFTQAKSVDGLAIERVISNIKEGECQVCALPLEEFDVFIVRCCGLIVCDICGIKGNNVQLRYNYKIKATTVCGACANCKHVIYPQKDLIFVDKSINLESIMSAKGDEKPIEMPVEEPIEVVVDPNAPPEIKNPKLKALLAIIQGRTPDLQEKIKISIPRLLEGRVDMPPKPSTVRKVLVFANFNETLTLVEEFLVSQGIKFLRLHGTYTEKAETIRLFKSGAYACLLINSQQHCAGLDIQFATDLVYFHKITDQNIEAQVAGRAQRIGRTCNLRIHYLAYENERALI